MKRRGELGEVGGEGGGLLMYTTRGVTAAGSAANGYKIYTDPGSIMR